MKLSTLGKCLILMVILLTTACSPTNPNPTHNIEFPASQIEVVNQPTETMTFSGNPAAYYCSVMMGYDYQITKGEDGGEYGECIMPTGEVCRQWDFYSGQCGADYSYCAVNDMAIETRTDGNDPFSPTYAVCIDGNDRSGGIRISDLMNLEAPVEEVEPGGNRDANPEITPEALNALPSSFNWRDVDGDNWLSPVKNQSGCGSCWAFSAVGIMESYYNLYAMNPDLDLDFSEEHLVSNCYYQGCSGGQSNNALSYIRDHGIVDEACFPYPTTASGYDDYELPCASICADPTYNKIPSVIYEFYDFTPEELKFYLTQYGPLSVSLSMTGSYNPSTGVMECESMTPGITNHAVVLTGYDDAGGYWIAKNSWGTDYQDGGYFKVAYDNCNIDNSRYAYIPITQENTYLPLIQNSGENISLTAEPISPVGGVTVNTLVPTFEWINDINASNYNNYLLLEVSEDPIIDTYSKKETTINWGWQASTLWNNLESDTTYYWHLFYNADIGSGEYIEFPPSATQTFTTGSGGTYPMAPNLIYPQSAQLFNSNNVTLQWESPPPNPNMYEAIIENYSCDNVWGCGYRGYRIYTSMPYMSLNSLLDDFPGTNEFTWYVRSQNDYAWGDFSETRNFWVSPYTIRPENLQPSGGTTINGIVPELSWSTDNIPDGSFVYYQISKDPLFQPSSTIIRGYQTDPYIGSIVIGQNLDLDTQYYWRAAYDFYNAEEDYWEVGPFSPAVSFTTSSTVNYPAAPVLSAPSDGATGLSDPIIMSWNPVYDAEEYQISILYHTEEDGPTNISAYLDQTSETSYRLPPFLLDESTHFTWLLKARNSEAWSDYSTSWGFSTDPGAMSFTGDRQAELDKLMVQIDSNTTVPLRILESILNRSEITIDPNNLPEGVRMYFRSEDGEITFFEPTP